MADVKNQRERTHRRIRSSLLMSLPEANSTVANLSFVAKFGDEDGSKYSRQNVPIHTASSINQITQGRHCNDTATRQTLPIYPEVFRAMAQRLKQVVVRVEEMILLKA